ncbi:MAG: hypothetical protein KatS3mg031_1831 [Chitinophagales bacterium]|nr:MAG: hypothetical protein KatS3mg031_1831 [Chitinophagales bacterium]
MKKYAVLLSHIDNRMVIRLNNKTIYDSGISYKPVVFNPPYPVQLSGLTSPGTHALRFEFYNGAASAVKYQEMNPYRFAYRIVEFSPQGEVMRDVVPPVSIEGESVPCIWLPDKFYVIRCEEGACAFSEKKF